MSIITFTFDPLKPQDGSTNVGGINPLSAMSLGMNPELRKKCGEIDEDSDMEIIGQPKIKKSATNVSDSKSEPLKSDAYPCSYKAKDQQLAGYINVTDPTCTFCEEVCQPPDVDDSIGFFDGFDTMEVGIVYGTLLVFTLLYQIWVCKYQKPKTAAQLNEVKNEHLYKSF